MIRWAISIAIATRLLGIILSNDFSESISNILAGRWHQQFNTISRVNTDELLIAGVANNVRTGLGFVSANEIHRPGYVVNATALRPSYPVFIHIICMKMYGSLFPDEVITIRPEHPYLRSYAVALHLISLILLAVSMPGFLLIAERIGLSGRYLKATVLLYLLYPSVFHFVGNLPGYESIALSLFIMATSRLMKSVTTATTTSYEVGSAAIIIAATLIRPQLLIITIVVVAGFLLHGWAHRRNFLRFTFAFASLFVLTAIPVWSKNHRVVGHYTLSTQTGFSLFEGHNPFARGSWCGDCHINPSRPMYQYIRQQVPDFESLPEFEKSEKLKSLAISWSISHPVQEVVLSARKVVMFFLPENSDHNRWNPLNTGVHLLTIASVLVMLYKVIRNPSQWKSPEVLMIFPILGALILSEIFFVGYRWRYFAEPFMILLAVNLIREWLKYRIGKG